MFDDESCDIEDTLGAEDSYSSVLKVTLNGTCEIR